MSDLHIKMRGIADQLGAPDLAVMLATCQQENDDGRTAVFVLGTPRELWAMADALLAASLAYADQIAEAEGPLCSSCQPFLDRIRAASAAMDRPGMELRMAPPASERMN